MDWVELISRLGFPIAVCVALSCFIWHLYKASEKREDKLMEVNQKAINTIALYADRLSVIEEDVSQIKTDIKIIVTGVQNDR